MADHDEPQDESSPASFESPAVSRPSMPPAYGILGPSDGKGLLPWSWAVKRLTRARGYWLATTRPDGRPHVAVIWGVWMQDRFYFATSPDSRKGRNLAASPNCVLCPEHTDEAVIVEGTARKLHEHAQIDLFVAEYAAKYREEIDVTVFPAYVLRPSVAFATISEATEFVSASSRWVFPDAARHSVPRR